MAARRIECSRLVLRASFRLHIATDELIIAYRYAHANPIPREDSIRSSRKLTYKRHLSLARFSVALVKARTDIERHCVEWVYYRHSLLLSIDASPVVALRPASAGPGPSLAAAIALLLLMLLGDTDGAPAAANFSSCWDVEAMAGVNPDSSCCTLPAELMAPGGPRGYIDWAEYRRRNLPRGTATRVRPAAHLAAANATYLDQLHRAYELMKALPRDDPRSFAQQVSLHCLPGVGMVTQLGYPGVDYSAHFTWIFMPYHRMYTFFLERILGKLVGDDTFALPFWNWDNQLPLHPHLPNVIPFYFRDPERYPALYHSARDPRHLPGNPQLLVDLSLSNVEQRIYTDDPDKLRAANKQNLHDYVVRPGAHFMSAPMRTGDEAHANSDSFEYFVHGAVHLFVGDPDNGFMDLGLTPVAVRDPIFGAHHVNIDPLWALWQSLGRQDYSDPDFLAAPFYFYEENAQLVRVTAGDTLDHRALMYDWQPVEDAWIQPDDRQSMAGVVAMAGLHSGPSATSWQPS